MKIDSSWFDGVPPPPEPGDVDDPALAARLAEGRTFLEGGEAIELYPTFAEAY